MESWTSEGGVLTVKTTQRHKEQAIIGARQLNVLDWSVIDWLLGWMLFVWWWSTNRRKRALYILISIIVEDLSWLGACCCYVSAQCGYFEGLAVTVLIQMTLQVFISAGQMFIKTFGSSLVSVMKSYDNRWAQLYLKRATNGYGQSLKATLAMLILCIQGFY